MARQSKDVSSFLMCSQAMLLLVASDERWLSKPNQSAEGRDLRETQVDVPLLAIPSSDRIAGLCNRHLNSNWGICLR
jgi:hypothetical protein